MGIMRRARVDGLLLSTAEGLMTMISDLNEELGVGCVHGHDEGRAVEQGHAIRGVVDRIGSAQD